MMQVAKEEDFHQGGGFLLQYGEREKEAEEEAEDLVHCDRLSR
jgi:hypothetical protein